MQNININRFENEVQFEVGVWDYMNKRLLVLVFSWLFLVALVIFRANIAGFIQTKPIFYGDEKKIASTAAVKPDFSQITDVTVKKNKFIQYLKPYIEASNSEVLEVRKNLLRLKLIAENGSLNDSDKSYLKAIAGIYRCPNKIKEDKSVINELLIRVDIVPVSLALAQAANETAWGTSRFAVDGNNYFGIWCFKPGCGIVPKLRSSGEKHEVAKFDSPQGSAFYYLKQLNSHKNYELLRSLRTASRESEAQVISGATLADGVVNYSAIGQEYVDSIRAIIRVNKLDRFDFIIR